MIKFELQLTRTLTLTKISNNCSSNCNLETIAEIDCDENGTMM